MREPRAPEHVRVVFTDGTSSGDLPLVYLGTDDHDGMHVWEALAPDRDDYTTLRVALLPPRTRVVIAI